MYGSSFWIATFSPRDLKRRPSEAVVMPLPRPEATPPVTKMYFGCALTTGCEPSRRSRRAARVRPENVPARSCFSVCSFFWHPSDAVEPAERGDRLDRTRERDRLGDDVQGDRHDGAHDDPPPGQDDVEAHTDRVAQQVRPTVAEHRALAGIGPQHDRRCDRHERQ